ncbi:uncharacterized protein [Drosophila kikkawai]|uniref:Uncharacterized protein LOC108082138 isoform X1 n=1 Tax=Drosophila kikkawai TaxID=30033 RepID=A0A6P4IWI4_DROKI|nr:uncharacterized protein LOC108082138 [Drosophila kikkawai]XP_041632945.1 uncharacterized protein LOC108082138 [Drosophila kikkawai]
MEGGCCNLRMNCIIGGFWLMLYYTALAFLMLYEIDNSVQVKYIDSRGKSSYRKNATGFWVLGVCFLSMTLVSLSLILGTLMRHCAFIIVFLFSQIIPVSVELFYLLIALMYGIETEFVFIYLLPFLYLIYIDVVSYFYLSELRRLQDQKTSIIDIEY